MEFSALLFVPGMKPFEAVEGERISRVRLHVRRMFITDKAELLPHWLRFVQGVVDTEDLPLNVSREMLQATPVLARIRKAPHQDHQNAATESRRKPPRAGESHGNLRNRVCCKTNPNPRMASAGSNAHGYSSSTRSNFCTVCADFSN